MDKLIIISGASGSGKTTILKYLLENNPYIEQAISVTTRTPRNGEINGVDYYFIDTNEFNKKIKNNEFIEYEEVYKGTYYGTLKSEVNRISKLNRIMVAILDVEGALSVRKLLDNSLLIFIAPPNLEILEKRLNNRSSENIENLKLRIDKAQKEIEKSKFFDHIFINDDLNICQKTINKCINTYINK